jgi:hypothetical protein
MRIGNAFLAVALRELLAALNSYYTSSYLLLKRRSPFGILARPGGGLTMLHSPARGENAQTAFADRFTGGATINSITSDADRMSGSLL